MGAAEDELRAEVEALLKKPYAVLMSNPKICDMFTKVFGDPLCRSCESDRVFAHMKLTTYLKDGKTTYGQAKV